MQSQTRDSESAPLPTRIGPFLIASEVARGQLATVYIGYSDDAEDAPPRAVKRVRSALAGVTGWGELIADEAQLLARIDHPNVVGVEGVGEDGGVYVALEYVEGENLERLLRLPGVARSPAMVCSIIADALRGLAHAHAAVGLDGAPLRLVHQAPRARHILVGVDGRARVADFTQAQARTLSTNSLRRQRLRAGSMAPEHTLAPKHVDLRADLFILGMTLWEALTERPLFETKLPGQPATGEALTRYPHPSSVGAKPPACFDALCMRALHRDPERRFGSAAEMLEALLAAAKEVGGAAPAAEVAQWVQAAVARRPPLVRPPFPPEASGSYRKPAIPEAARQEDERELALEAPPSKVTQELFAPPRKSGAEQAAAGERTEPSERVGQGGAAAQSAAKASAAEARFASTMAGLSPPLSEVPADTERARTAEAESQRQAAAKRLEPAPTLANVLAPRTGEERERDQRAAVEEVAASKPAGAAAPETPAAAVPTSPVAPVSTSTRVAAPPAGVRPQAELRRAQPQPRAIAAAAARSAAKSGVALERLSLVLVTAALVSSMLVAGDWLIRQLLPSPAPAQLNTAALPALPPPPRTTPSRAAADASKAGPAAPAALAPAEQAPLEQVPPAKSGGAARNVAPRTDSVGPAAAPVLRTQRSRPADAEPASPEQTALPDNPY